MEQHRSFAIWVFVLGICVVYSAGNEEHDGSSERSAALEEVSNYDEETVYLDSGNDLADADDPLKESTKSLLPTASLYSNENVAIIKKYLNDQRLRRDISKIEADERSRDYKRAMSRQVLINHQRMLDDLNAEIALRQQQRGQRNRQPHAQTHQPHQQRPQNQPQQQPRLHNTRNNPRQ